MYTRLVFLGHEQPYLEKCQPVTEILLNSLARLVKEKDREKETFLDNTRI